MLMLQEKLESLSVSNAKCYFITSVRSESTEYVFSSVIYVKMYCLSFYHMFAQDYIKLLSIINYYQQNPLQKNFVCTTRAVAKVVQKTQPHRPHILGASRFIKNHYLCNFIFFINANLRRLVKTKPTSGVNFEKILPWKLQFSAILVNYMIYFQRSLIDRTYLNLP